MSNNVSNISMIINTNPEHLWTVLTEANYTKQYMFNCAVKSDWKLGSPITWQGNYQGYEAFQKGEILGIEPNRLLKYSTFDPNFGLADKAENYIHVTYKIKEVEDKTELVIINETFDGNEERIGHINQGWAMVVDKIKEVAEGFVPIHNFDFLEGKWNVINKRLKERLSGCEEWIKFDAEMETNKMLNRLGFMDEMKSSHFGDEFVGLSLRLFDPKSEEWKIYWADTAHPELFLSEQVSGKFENGIGTFYGMETYNGKSYKLRFTWKRSNYISAHWDQAYYDEESEKWEVNWTMEFTQQA